MKPRKERIKKCVQTIAYAVVLSLMLTLVVRAEEHPDTDKTLSPYMFIKNGDESVDRMPLKASSADILINGVIADVTLTQTYENRGTRPINARYVFRLQHLGPPCIAMVCRLWEVIRLASIHSSLETGLAPVIILMKIPVPTAAPQLP